MCLDNRFGYAEESGSADLISVHSFLHFLQAVFDQQCTDLCLQALHQGFLDHAGHHFGDTLRSLQKDVAGEAIRHNDIHKILIYTGCFHISDKIDPSCISSFFQQRKGLMPKCISLGIFRTDI